MVSVSVEEKEELMRQTEYATACDKLQNTCRLLTRFHQHWINGNIEGVNIVKADLVTQIKALKLNEEVTKVNECLTKFYSKANPV